MKKASYLLSVIAFALFGAITVNAATPQDLLSWNVAEGNCDTDNKVCDLKLKANAIQDLEIGADQTVTLDLNGKSFTNFSDGTSGKGKLSAIWVLGGGKLTIKDTSTEQTGKVYVTGNDDTMPAVNNLAGGTLIIEGGTYEAKIAGGNAIFNSGNLTFVNGTVTTSVNGAWGLINEGTATIEDGKFNQGNDFSVVLNAKDMTIEDGEFTSTGTGHNALVSNVGKTEDAPAKLIVTGGDFNAAEDAKIFANGLNDTEENGTIAVSGGSFSKAIKSQHLAEGFELEEDEEGNIIIVEIPEDEPMDEPEKDDSPKTGVVDYTLIAGIIAAASMGAYLDLKKRFN